jgi:hypothetical protein
MEENHWVWSAGSGKGGQLLYIHLIDDKIALQRIIVDISTPHIEDVATVEGFVGATLRIDGVVCR